MLTGVSGYLTTAKTHFYILLLRNQCASERLLSLRQARFLPKWQIEMPYGSKIFASGGKAK